MSVSAAPPPTTTAWSYARRLLAFERGDIAVVLVYGAAAGLLSLATPVAVSALVNTVAFGSLIQPIIVLTVLLAAALGSYGLVRVLQVWAVEAVLQRLFVRALTTAGRRLATADPTAFDQLYAPTVVHRVFELPSLQKALTTLLVDGVGLALQGAVGLLLLAAYHPLLLVFSTALMAALALVIFVLGRGAVASALAESAAKYRAIAWLEQLARMPTALRSARGLAAASERTDRTAMAWLTHRRSHFARLLAQHIGGVTIAVIGNTALLGVGGFLVLREQLTLGQLVAAELVVGSISAALVKLGKQLEAVYDLVASATKLGLVTDLAAEPSGQEPADLQGPTSITLAQVEFCYPGGAPLLRGANLGVRARGHLALFGSGGTGKSTVLDLVFGTRQVSAGQVSLNGIDLRLLALPTVREHVILVRHDDLIEGTLLDNLRLWAPDADMATIDAVVQRVGLAPTLVERSDGYQTALVPSGAPLSTTQRRRLALARALLARPRLLLIDEVLDDLGLDAADHAKLLTYIFSDRTPWTAIVATRNPVVARAATTAMRIRDGVFEEVQP